MHYNVAMISSCCPVITAFC